MAFFLWAEMKPLRRRGKDKSYKDEWEDARRSGTLEKAFVVPMNVGSNSKQI